MLRLDSLHKRFGAVTALDGCGFTVKPGQMLGFLGPNGAGKTTAMRAIFGLVRPDAGSVTWNSAPITHQQRLRFGYMPEERGLYPRMRVRDQLVYFGRLHGLDRAAADAATDRWLEAFGLLDRADGRLEELSHGNQQRVQLAAALLHDPELLVLDEPFSGLDPIGAQTMAGVLEARAAAGAAVLFSSHQLDVVEHLCREVVIIHQGRVVLSGDVERLRSASPRRYLDVVIPGAGSQWVEHIPGVRIVEQRADHLRLLVSAATDLGALVAAAEVAGQITQFSFEPPDLSEVFLEAVRS